MYYEKDCDLATLKSKTIAVKDLSANETFALFLHSVFDN
jgi:hypothetical protein